MGLGRGRADMKKPPTRDGLICKPVACASGRINFVSMRRIALVLTHKYSDLFNFREKTHEASVLDSKSDLALILSRGAGNRAWGDFSVWGDEALKKFNILVVNELDVVLLEVAHLAAGMHFLKSHGCFLSIFRKADRPRSHQEIRGCFRWKRVRSERLVHSGSDSPGCIRS